MSETIDPDVLSTLVEHHRRFVEFLEARVGRREVAGPVAGSASRRHRPRHADVEAALGQEHPNFSVFGAPEKWPRLDGLITDRDLTAAFNREAG